MPEGADPMDVRYNMINWVHRSTRGWSYGVVDHRSAHGRDHQGPRLARIAARAAGLPDRRRPALAVHERHRAAAADHGDGPRPAAPALGARGRPHARALAQLLRQHDGPHLGDGLPASARDAQGGRHDGSVERVRRRHRRVGQGRDSLRLRRVSGGDRGRRSEAGARRGVGQGPALPHESGHRRQSEGRSVEQRHGRRGRAQAHHERAPRRHGASSARRRFRRTGRWR